MIEIECRSSDPAACPVQAWRRDGYDRRCEPAHIIRYGYDRDVEQRFLCKECHRTFTLAKARTYQHGLPKDVTSFHEYLMLEVAWRVVCAGTSLSTAARLAGIDWATARRWRDRALERWGTELCTTLDAEDVAEEWDDRVFRTTSAGSSGTEADERWIRAASAAAALYTLLAENVITESKYEELWWMRDRARTSDPEWSVRLEGLRWLVRQSRAASPPKAPARSRS